MPAKRSAFQWRPPRVRHEPPTLAEAFAAARDLADDTDAQVAIAAGLMGIPVDEARVRGAAELARRMPDSSRNDPLRTTMTTGRRPAVVVERRISRASGIRRS